MSTPPSMISDSQGETDRIVLAELCGSPMDVGVFLGLATAITEAVDRLHRCRVIHKNIRPSLIVVHQETGDVHLADPSSENNPDTLLGGGVISRNHPALAYASPEQLGRFNRVVDSRSDLYSLGVIFYHMLTGSLPFEADDLLEWVHCHVARAARLPLQVQPAIPPVLSDIVMRLLAKTLEERYQTAAGLQYDLAQCAKMYEAGLEISPFVLGTADIPNQLLIPERLYGREEDVELLRASFKRVHSRGLPEMVLVAGYAGIGKTALVKQLYRPVIGDRAFFVLGKFDQFKRNIPYETFIEAFKGLIRQLLTEQEEKLDSLRQALLAALDSNGQIIIDLIPQVELIIGSQPAVPELPPAETENRLHLVLRNFIGVFARKQQPLVMFLDDLQWADIASLKLVEQLITDTETRHLLLIGAYRDSEVGPTHPLTLTIEAVRNSTAVLQDIHLGPLSREDLAALLADTLRAEIGQLEPLTALIHRKTAGNPFFVLQFLIALHDEGLVAFDQEAGCWQWSIDKISSKGFTDNVIDLMMIKLQRLDPATRDMLRLASCIGNTFDLETLISIGTCFLVETRLQLSEAVKEVLLIEPEKDRFQFVHDRIQQAAYSLTPEMERTSLHLRIGRQLLATCRSDERIENIFEIVDHFSRGAGLIIEREERWLIAELGMTAGKRAKTAGGYASAQKCFALALDLLGEDGWEERFELTFQLNRELAETHYLNGRHQKSRLIIDHLLERAASPLQQAELYNMLIIQHTLAAQYQEAIDCGREALKIVNMELPEADFERALKDELAHFTEILGSRKIATLAQAKEMTDQRMRVCLELLANMLVPARYSNNILFALIAAIAVNLSLRFGPTAKSTVGYTAFAMVLQTAMGRYRDAYDFGILALRISERFLNPAQKCQACMVLGHYLNHWVSHLKNADAILDEGFRAGLAGGELQWTGYILAYRLFQPYSRGGVLAEVEKEIPAYRAFTEKTGNQWATDTLTGLQLALSFLRVDRSDTSLAEVSALRRQEEAFLAECLERRSFGALGRYGVLQAQLYFLFGEKEQGLAAIELALERIGFFSSSISVVELNFYHSLILAALAGDAREADKTRWLDTLKENQLVLKAWAAQCKVNFLHRYLLIKAELARIEGRLLDAGELYEQAVAEASEQGYLQDEAVAAELAGNFYLERQHLTISNAYLLRARSCYRRWGAAGKVRQLDHCYPMLRRKEEELAAGTLGLAFGNIDVMAVVRASQALSSEIVLSSLMESLMQTVLQNAGAQRASLLLLMDGRLQVAALARVEGQTIQVEQPELQTPDKTLPHSILNYVQRTGEIVLIDDGSAENMFSADPYFESRQSLSLLCLPLLRQSKLIGMLYLENNLMRAAFTKDRLAVLELLSSQAAISLENAALYEERRRAEQALRESEEKYRTIFEDIGTPLLFIEEDKTISMFNRAFEELSGYSRAESEGRLKWTELVATKQDLERMSAFHSLRRRDPAAAPKSYEFQLLDRHEHTRDVVVTVNMLRDTKQSLVSLLDITERKQAEEEQARLATAIEQSAEAVFITDTAFMIHYANPAVLRISGFSLDDILDCSMDILSGSSSGDKRFAHMRSALSRGEAWSGRLHQKKKDGSVYDAEVTASPVRDRRGVVINYVIIHRDISREIQLEKEVRQAHKMEAIGTLAGGIAHDFNNILTVIQGHAQLMQVKLTESSTHGKSLEQIFTSCIRARDLVRQILAFSRKTEHEKQPVNIAELLTEILQLLRSSLPSTIDIIFEVDIERDQCTILADATQIHQVIMNLATNAAHAMRQHGGVLGVRLLRERIEDNSSGKHPGLDSSLNLPGGNYILVAISDTGCGIEENIIERIFDPYFTTKGPGEGSGMGLAVTQGIVKGHQGRISVVSEVGVGTVFRVYFPESDMTLVSEQEAVPVLLTGSEHILLVDDEQDVVTLVKNMLQHLGYRVTARTKSEAALTTFLAAPLDFDLVLTDMTMPKMTGLEIAEKIIAIRPNTPIILCSGFSESVYGMESANRGIREVVMKPFEMHELASVLRRALDDPGDVFVSSIP